MTSASARTIEMPGRTRWTGTTPLFQRNQAPAFGVKSRRRLAVTAMTEDAAVTSASAASTHTHMKIDPTTLTWKRATKTKPIKAKPLACLLVDRSVASKFLVDTLEGRESLGHGVIICAGAAGDTWQQAPNKLLAKYTVTAIDADGWMHCEPKPGNAVECSQIGSNPWGESPEGAVNRTRLYVIAQWGERSAEGLVQYCEPGDYICRHLEDSDDVWVVRRNLFENTYEIIQETPKSEEI